MKSSDERFNTLSLNLKSKRQAFPAANSVGWSSGE